jgi:hypothetical protein
MYERQFLQTVSAIQELCWLQKVCHSIGAPTTAVRVAKRSLLLLNNEKIKTSRELQQMIAKRLQSWCDVLIELAPAITALDEHTVDHVIDILYGCWISTSEVVAPAAQAIIVETVRRWLTSIFDCAAGLWWSGDDVIALSQKPDVITITLSQRDKNTEWTLQTPCNSYKMRRWIESVRNEIMSRVSCNAAE